MNLTSMVELVKMVDELCNSSERITDYVVNDEDKSVYVRLTNEKEFVFFLK